MAVARLEGEAMRLERQGEKEEAVNLRARANKMRYEDPYTALQDELDEAIKNEVRKHRSPFTILYLPNEVNVFWVVARFWVKIYDRSNSRDRRKTGAFCSSVRGVFPPRSVRIV